MDWRKNPIWLVGIVIFTVAGCSRAPESMAENGAAVPEIALPDEFSRPHAMPEAKSALAPPRPPADPGVEKEPSPVSAEITLPPDIAEAAPAIPNPTPKPSGVSISLSDSPAASDSSAISRSSAFGGRNASGQNKKYTLGKQSAKSPSHISTPTSPTKSKPSWSFSTRGGSGSSWSAGGTPAAASASTDDAAAHVAASDDQLTFDTRLSEEAEIEEVAVEEVAANTATEELARSESAIPNEPDPLTSDTIASGSNSTQDSDADSPYRSVDVLYATDRLRDTHTLSAYQLSGQRQLISLLGMGVAATCLLSLLALLFRRTTTAKLCGVLTVACCSGAAFVFFTGGATIEKTGVTYTGDRGKLTRGVCRVTVPKSHTPGTVERPSLLKFEVSEDQAKHIVLTSVDELPVDAFEQRLKTEIAEADQPDLLVFIHGYNVDFESAVLRTAQIAVDLPFEGVPVCYSWPSQGTLIGYPVDENNAAWTVGHLKEFLNELVDRSGAKSIHVVAHSMGNRAMTAAMQQMALARQGSEPIFDRVVLAAPDVDADLFRKDLAGALTQIAEQVTLYASSDDQALVASKAVHGYPRAGETGEFLVVVPGVDTIDVSGIDLSLLGHSYYGDSEAILRDLYEVLLSRLPAYKRSSLISRAYESQVYWQLAHGGAIAASPQR
ncbi:alpha/beta hydrolase [Rhodopirellula sallentina]|uniref:Membrane protein containing DUF900, hydrolase-like protein n=1 Tax=Rhodopirellula sallentina SM41 TaxID=1263870 RepID=M5UFQ1_9BACT|nr:alpha/beta fold hydrolase [Rhodopirellula sallentina]EMI54828.1 membrane protein containing DUF900, hydrolase-like protein [Rhodopirellula sallentina SM41]